MTMFDAAIFILQFIDQRENPRILKYDEAYKSLAINFNGFTNDVSTNYVVLLLRARSKCGEKY